MSNADTHREMHDLFNGRDFDAIVKRFTDDFHYVDQARGVGLSGREAFKAWLTEWTTAMSTARCSDARYVDGGTTSVAIFTGRGTHDGPLGPIPPSGKELEFPVCEVMTYDDDGNVTGGEIYYDQMLLMGQASADPQTVVSVAGQTEAFWMLGGLYELLLSADQTAGAATVIQMTLPAGAGPPPHTHPGSESVYVIEGTLRYHIGGETYEAGAGSLFHVPAGVLECFEPVTDVRLLVTYSPGGAENFFREAGEPAERREIPPPSDTPPDLERLVEVAARHGMHIHID